MIWMLDASAVLCWLLAEPGFERMEEILAGPDPIIIHAVNLVEVWYVVLRLGPTAWTMAQERIAAIGVTVDHTTDEAFLREAARLKAERAPIVLGDVFASLSQLVWAARWSPPIAVS